jgi:hypothetical protein
MKRMRVTDLLSPFLIALVSMKRRKSLLIKQTTSSEQDLTQSPRDKGSSLVPRSVRKDL